MTVSPNPDMTITHNGKSVRTNLATLKKAANNAGGDNARFDVPGDHEFFSAKFMDAPALEAIANSLIGSMPEFGGLEDPTIRYVWQRKGATSAGKMILGKCTKVSGIAQFFGDCDYVVTIAADHARELKLTNHQMQAAVYHELCHIEIGEDEKTGDPIYGARGHDVEMYLDEIRRYGLWRESLEAAAKAFEQLSLFEQEAR